MRAALSTIQQTLTPEAAAVLSHSMAEAGRPNHGQTTPLHVAATLLAAPSGYLRQACIRSHPNSSHPLQCRALELCFSVALERLPTAQSAAAPGTEPPISNALLAALKRAQAHQRRGCPEQQQQPLLAVKVELEQLIVSILDDPSVSRVMREASFSSPAVKATIEQSLSSSNPHHAAAGNATFGSNFRAIGPRIFSNSPPTANRNIYLNPRLQPEKTEDLNILLEIIARSKKRNPIVVGDSEPEALLNEFFRKLENKEIGILSNAQVVSMEKGLLSDNNQIQARINELGSLIARKITSGGVVLDLGDLKWLVEKPASFGGVAVAEITKLVARFSDVGGVSEGNKLWLIGRATCETYLRCQVYHSTMENDWGLQAVPVAPRTPLPATFPRLGSERVLNNPVESVVPSPILGLTMRGSENLNPIQRPAICPQCSENCEKELAKLAAIERSFSEARQDSTQVALPPWLQNAKQNNPAAGMTNGSSGKKQELQKKWRDTCLHLHPNFHQNGRADRAGPPALTMASLRNPNLLSHPKLQMAKPMGGTLQLNMNPVVRQPAELAKSLPGSPVRTDLVLGRKECNSVPEKVTEDPAKDFLGCITSELQTKTMDKFSKAVDADAYKKLLKGLMEKVWWQAEAASAVASAVTRCRLGNGKRRGGGSRGDVWLLFMGPDRVGKKKMASVLASQVCGASPVTICLGLQRDGEDSDMNFRGKTAVDRITEVVRRNPSAVILLEDIDEADALVRGSIKQAIDRGRLTDFYGREVGLGNALFIVTGDWSTMRPEALRDDHFVDEKKLAAVASGRWKLGLIVREKSAKRRLNWLLDDDKRSKTRKETQSGLSLDLNLASAYAEDDKTDGSHNSSDLTIDHEDDLSPVNWHFSITSAPHDLVTSFDDSILFKPVNSAFVRNEVKKTISIRFAIAMDNDNVPIDVEDDVLEKILGGLWHDRTSLEEWIEKVVAPSFDELKTRLLSVRDRSNTVVCLVVESSSDYVRKSNDNGEDWLPSSIHV